ncbi:MAG: dual specificity protein phosphatase [candidate division NC10 bacterium]
MSWFWNGEERRNGNGIDFLTEDLAVANLGAASDLEALTRHGIQAVVDASNRDGNPRFPGILYHDVPIADPDERLSQFLPDVVAFIDEARRRGPVLLHCVAGISRSPALAICYLHERHGMSLLAALAHVRSRRPVADPHPMFLRVIQEYYLGRGVTPVWQLDLFPESRRRGSPDYGREGG